MTDRLCIHGGDIYTEGIFKGKKILDFSSNINPLGIPESFLKNLNIIAEKSVYYPDIEYRQLKKSIVQYLKNTKEHFGGENIEGIIESSNIILGNGAAEIIDVIMSSIKSVCIVVPSFIEYDKSAEKWNLIMEYSYLKKDMTLNYEDILEKLKNCDALIVGNPNNPNGGIFEKSKAKEIINYCEENNKLIIIDEAFVEFTGNQGFSYINQAMEKKCLFIIRAITKFYALPGIRFGYGFSANEKLIEKLIENQNPWNINCFAEGAANYVLKDDRYIEKSLEWINKESSFMKDKLSKIDCIEKVYPSNCNFLLCKLKNINCDELYSHCMKNDIAIRKCDNYKGLDNSYVRFAVKDRKSNLMLIAVLEEALK